MQAYNDRILSLNSLIIQQKKASQTAASVNTLKKQLDLLQLMKRRGEPNIDQLCTALIELGNEKNAADRQKGVSKDSLNRYCTEVLQGFERRINQYLDQFGAGFSIHRVKHNYQGGTPSCQFQIVVNGVGLDAGESSAMPGSPCFGTVLSAGDRGALALAFFLAVLEADPTLGSKIVILDDPFSSLDRFRRICTQQMIHRVAGSAAQVIVMSHDPLFLQLLTEGFSPSDIRTLQVSRTADTSVLTEWDIETETAPPFLQDYGKLLKYYSERVGDPRSVRKGNSSVPRRSDARSFPWSFP